VAYRDSFVAVPASGNTTSPYCRAVMCKRFVHNKILTMTLKFTLLKGDYSICRLKNDSIIPGWVYDSQFYSVTRTKDELSIICKDVDINHDVNTKIDKPWRILKINGPLDLSLVGIIANISNLLKDNNIPIFTISTFETDYILIKNQDLNKTMIVLNSTGHETFIEN
jgi:hypothetical protein